jgi:fibronectin-binding autotransporter adhesin
MKSSFNPFLHIATLTAATTVFLSHQASATDYSWGGGSLDWTDTSASGWNGGPPAAGDNATINSGIVTLPTNNLVNPLNSITIGGTGKLTQVTGNSWSQLNNLTLQGGTLESVSTTLSTFGCYWMPGTVTVSGASASTISTVGTGVQFINMGDLGSSTGATTFNVADATSGADLLVSTRLGNEPFGNAAGLIKTGAGTMTLSANNIYSGGTTVNSGVLEISGSSAGNSHIRGTATVNSGAELRFTGGDGTGFGFNGGNKLDTVNLNDGLLDAQDSMTHLFGATVNMTGGELRVNGGTSSPTGFRIEWNHSTVNTSASASAATISGRINLRDDGAYTSAVFNVEDGAAATDLLISAAITQSSVVGITKNGAGTMELSGSNSYTGTTTVNEGTLKVGRPFFSDTSAVVIASDAKINLNHAASDIVGSLIIGGVTVPSGSYNLSHPTYGSSFEGTGTLEVGAPGPQLSGTWISSSNGNWSDSANWDTGNVANGTDNTATFNPGGPVTVTVDGDRYIGGLAFTGSNTTLAGTDALKLDNTAFSPSQVSVANSIIATLATNIAGNPGLEKTGPGTLVITSAKSYSGGTLVTAGTLELSGATAGNAQIHGSLTVNTGATVAITSGDGTGFGFYNNPVTSILVDGGTINAISGSHLGFGAFMSMTLDNGGSLSGSWQWNGDSLLNFSSFGDNTNTISGQLFLRSDDGASHTFTVNDGTAATDLQINAVLADQWPENNSVPASGLTKSGTGTMVLAGANTYNGSTVVNDGALSVAVAGSLQFRPTTNGVTNSVSGSATASLSFLGIVDLDLSAANTTINNSWNLFDLASFTGPAPVLVPASVTSNLGNFSEVTPGTWELPVTGAKWVFTEADGNLSYVSAANDYDTWKTANGVTGGENDDDDNDGLTNHEEYAFGLDPTGGSSVDPIAVPLDKTTGTFSYTRRTQSLTGLTYSVWYSTDLSTWAKDAGAVEGTVTTSGEVETVPVTLSAGLLTNPKLFIQVRAQ